MRLQELQEKNEQAQKLRAEQPVKKNLKNIDSMLYHLGLPYITEIIQIELISRHHKNPLASYFGIEKIHKLVARKYYWPTLRHDVDNYVKGCNVCLALKAIRHKPYSDLHFLLVLTHCWKYLLMDFVMGLPILTD